MRAVREQFWTSGYAGTSLDDLTAATGLGKGSLYGAFGDKHTLFLRAFGEYCDEAVDDVRGQLTGPGAAYQRLAQHVRGIAASVAADVDGRGCLLAKGTAELAATDHEIAERAKAIFTDLHAALTDCIAEAQNDRAIDPDADPARLAGVLLAVLRGMEALGKGGMAPDLVTDIGDQALALLPTGGPVRTCH
jgi:TetR/AcrR family transcriptional repressor of nem operon